MKRLCLLLALGLALTACATTPKQTDAEKLALYRAQAGEPVKDFRYFGSINGWTPLGDSALVVWTKPSEAFLLELYGPCLNLGFAPAITLSNTMGQVSARFDSVNVHGGGSSHMDIPCRIQTIRPLDVRALNDSKREIRNAETVERDPGVTAEQE